MKTKYIVLMALILVNTACGQPVVLETPAMAIDKPFVCSTDGGKQVNISLPNNCEIEGVYCVMADEVYDSKDVHVKKDSCVYKMLLELDVVYQGGGWN
jgi:hypothetical protein